MKKFKLKSLLSKVVTFSLIGLFSSNCVLSFAYPYVVGYHSLNNSTGSSFKTDKSLLNRLSDLFKTDDDFNEVLNYTTNQVFNTDSTIVSYLIENNIIGEDLNVDVDNLFDSESFKLFNYEDGSETVSKSDFLMTLSKAVYGVQESRPLVYFTDESSRLVGDSRKYFDVSTSYRPDGYKHLFNPNGYEDNDEDNDGENDEVIDFSKGDYLTYVTPNVYEMYFKTLIDKSIISKEEFSNIQFISDLTYMDNVSGGIVSTPLWSNGLGFYGVNTPNVNHNIEGNNGVRIFGEYPLGQAFLLDDDGNLKYNKIDWFFKEELLTIDALKYIEKILRTTEKDMTELEAKIITYKYGYSYMQFLSDDDVKTLQFLIAKGVLNFEDPTEFEGLYKELNMDLFLKLIYRVHNPNARLDFSKVQLTDSDNYWLSNGFSQGSLELKKSELYPNTTVTVEEASQISYEPIDRGLFKSRPTVIASSYKDYVVTRTFYSDVNYYYKGYKISTGTKFPQDSGVTEIKEVKDKDGKKVITVKFTVNAISPEAAIAIVDANTMTDLEGVNNIGRIPTFNKVDDNGNVVYYVSRDALESVNVPIKVIEDKYIMNTQTGARALLMENNRMVIVGNEVIKTDKTMVFNINGEVHYNFEIIAKLLNDVHIDRLDPGSVYITDIESYDKAYKIVSTHSLDEAIDVAYVNTFESSLSVNGKPKDYKFINLTQNNSLSNYVITNVGKDLGLENDCYMVIEFQYVVNQSLKNVVSSFDINKFVNNQVTMEDVYTWMYTQPVGSDTLNKWWKENVAFNDSLLNYVFGTKNSKFMKSGFLVSNINFLNDSKDGLTTEQLNNFFLSKVSLPTSVASINYNGKSFVESFFNYNGTNEASDSSANTLLKVGRTLKTYTNSKVDDKTYNYQDYGDFVINKSKQVYRNVETDPDIAIDGDSVKYVTKDYQDPSFRVGSIYTFVGLESVDYVCDYMNGDIVRMVRKEPLKTKYHSDRASTGKPLMVGDVELLEYINNSNKSITADATTLSSFSSAIAKPNAEMIEDDNIYFFDNEFWYKEPNKELRKLNTVVSKDKSILTSKDVLVYNFFMFKQNSLTPSSDNVVDKEYNFPFLSMSNYTNFGITDQVIDSIVYDSLGYVSLTDLPQGSKVTLGDLVFTKSGSSLVSGIINDEQISSEFVSVDLGSGSKEDVGTSAMVAKLFNSFNISIISKGVMKNNELLSSYITSAQIADVKETDSNSTLVRRNGKLYLLSKTGKLLSYESGMGFSSFVVSVKFEDSIKFRPIGSTGEYVLVTVASANADGYLEKLPYHSETLSYSDNDLFYSNLNKSLYGKSEFAEELFDKFNDLFKSQKRKDFLGLIQYLLSNILFVLTYTVLFVAYIKSTMVDVIIKEIAYPSSDRVGIDLYSIVTLGLIGVDTEITLMKSIFMSFILFALRAFINII